MDELIIEGGSILTLDEMLNFYPQGRIVMEAGLITSVELHEGPVSKKALDTSHCVVLPGFVNAHTHLFLTMWRGLDDDRELFPWLEVLSPAIGVMNAEDMRRSNLIGCMEALKTGTTTIRECCRYDPALTSEIASDVGLRSVSGGMPASEWFGRPLPTDLEGLAHATAAIMNGRDLYRGLATAHLGVHSPYNCSPAFIHEAKACAMSLGVRFGIHLAECNSELEIILERYGKTPVRHLHDLGVLDSSVIADHCVWFTEEDIDLFRESGAGIVHNPLANAKLGSGTAPIRKYLDAGIPLALGTDSVVSNNSLSMFEVIKCGLMIQRAVYPSGDGPPLGALDFLCMATKGGAQVLGMQDRIGMLEPGMRADLIVVELPPEIPADFARVVSHLVYSAKPSDLRLVVVDGQVVVRDGEIQTVDEAKLKAESRSYFDERWQEFGLTH